MAFRPAALSRAARAVLVCGLALVGGCRGFTERSYFFERAAARLPTGGEVAVALDGTPTRDSTDARLYHIGSPYWMAVYVTGQPGVEVARVDFTSTVTRRSVSTALPPLQVIDDSTRATSVDSVALPFEDHVATVHLSGAGGPRAIRLVMRKKYEERYESFWEWLGHI